MLLKVSSCCENLVHLASTIGELQHTEYLKLSESDYATSNFHSSNPVFAEVKKYLHNYCPSSWHIMVLERNVDSSSLPYTINATIAIIIIR